MSRELIRDLDVGSVLKAEKGLPVLDAMKFKNFLTAKGLPPTSVEALIPKIQERLTRASSFSGDRIPQRIIDWTKGQLNQELDSLVDASAALRGTSIAQTVAQATAPVTTPRSAPTDIPIVSNMAPNRIALNLAGNPGRIARAEEEALGKK